MLFYIRYQFIAYYMGVFRIDVLYFLNYGCCEKKIVIMK